MRDLTGLVRKHQRLTRSATGWLHPGLDGGDGVRKKGDRLGRTAQLAAHATWDNTAVTGYGREETVSVAEVRCLW
jgi:hypothetical protein